MIYFSEQGYQYLNNLLSEKNYSKIFVLTDSNTNELCSAPFLAEVATEIPIEVIEIEAGEAHKTIDTCTEIWKILLELGADRNSLMIGLGGGVITDMAGFVASVFKRGIAFVHVPTSLLGMVDAAIGGKNGVNLGNLKNQIGTITLPEMVLIDPRFLNTLPNDQIRSGYAEMLKHGLIFDKEYWDKLSDIKNIDFSDLEELIMESVAIKLHITSQDLNESGLRKTLNFGHTLGHAIESYFLENPDKMTLLHGEAVAVGMILESYISLQNHLLSETEYQHIKSVLGNIYSIPDFSETDVEKIIELLIFDKKNSHGKINFVLLQRIGQAVIDQHAEKETLLAAFGDLK